MTLIDRIPTLKDSELAQLLSNVRRLDVSGTPDERRQAAEVAPHLEREASRRREKVLMSRRAATARF
ncbi:hypothetical protein DMC25_03460 [Caulobacter sp. D4A]|uniref:hypothetical protein n=1 Tax=unclassified Caulobacter TaxID=2648921 RepID=UPI000D7341D6|nr:MULTISPECIES: hypothetical protein [unclassified Caulobacter]PXA92197.1 hypothetical protein DMC18_11665 [Caulobacter sp. D5]PXA93592.1 hypothetical protein DMC25_03460 [Caulobacter sp. D4A]